MNTKQIPNFFTLLRLVSIPILWLLAITQNKILFVVLFTLAALTDAFDGYFARKLSVASKAGSKFDSITDDLFGLSAIFCIFILLPEVIFENLTIILVLAGLFVFSHLLRLVKFKKFIGLHTILNKISAVPAFLFIIHALIFNYSKFLFYFTVIFFIVSIIEEIALALTRKHINENTKSIFT